MTENQNPPENESVSSNVMVQFVSEGGEETGGEFQMGVSASVPDLTAALKAVLPEPDEESAQYLFFLDDQLITDSLCAVLDATESRGLETTIRIRYQPEAQFKVRPVERCTASIPGHGEAIVALRFSPDSRGLATGSGDTTVRFWDLNTQSPLFTCSGHRQWVLCVEWSPDGRRVASGCRAGEIMLWDATTGKRVGAVMKRHKQWINALAWKPMHLDGSCRYLASASKDGSVIIWDTNLSRPLHVLSAHTKSVSCVRWGSSDLIYSCGQDCEVKVWRAADASHVRTLKRHAHWVNWLALSTDYLLRTGASYPAARKRRKEMDVSEDAADETPDSLQQRAKRIFESVTSGLVERMVSCSDDHTMSLWRPESKSDPIARMSGHIQTVIDVKFSPDGRWVASASFDKSIKLWNGITGGFIATLRAHVNRVYQVAWAGDSRLLVSGSVDSTLKLWNLANCLDPQQRTGARGDGRRPIGDLPGHQDEIYAVDWSPNGQFVASGGKDRVLKLWQY